MRERFVQGPCERARARVRVGEQVPHDFPAEFARGAREFRLATVARVATVRIFRAFREPRAVIHERGVPCARIVPVERADDERHDGVLAYLRPPSEKVVDEHAADVGFDEGDGNVERERGDGPRGGAADARKAFEEPGVAGERSAIFAYDGFREAFQGNRAPVVSEALPLFQNLPQRRPRESAKRGKFPYEPRVEHEYPRHLRLLKHHFGDHDCVRVARFPPRECVTPRAAIMIPHERAESSDGFLVRVGAHLRRGPQRRSPLRSR